MIAVNARKSLSIASKDYSKAASLLNLSVEELVEAGFMPKGSSRASVTPCGNTGSNRQAEGGVTLSESNKNSLEPLIHAFTGVCSVTTFGQVRTILDFVLGSGITDAGCIYFDSPNFSGQKYHHFFRSVSGIYCQWSLPADLGADVGRLRLSIPGNCFDQLALFASRCLLLGLFHAYKLRATRIDCAIDFYNRFDLLDLVFEAGKAKNFSGASIFDPRQPEKSIAGKTVYTGRTFYFGSTQSDKLIRIYDKSLESKGRIKAVRFEAQFRDDLAHQIFDNLCCDATFEDRGIVPRYLCAVVLGSLQFVDKSHGDRLSRHPRLQWYQDLIDLFQLDGIIKISSSRSKPVLEDIMLWIQKQIAPTLSVVADSLGRDIFKSFIADCVDKGRKRRSSYQDLVVEKYAALRRSGRFSWHLSTLSFSCNYLLQYLQVSPVLLVA